MKYWSTFQFLEAAKWHNLHFKEFSFEIFKEAFLGWKINNLKNPPSLLLVNNFEMGSRGRVTKSLKFQKDHSHKRNPKAIYFNTTI